MDDSSSNLRELLNLVDTLERMEGSSKCRIHFIHVAGTCMIAQGSDGLSRGNLTEGVMGEWNMGDFIPLHQGTLERSGDLEPWIRSWCDSAKHQAEVLEPEGWFEKGHDLVGGTTNSDGMSVPEYKNGLYIWAPPPAAAEAALEQLRKARQKKQNSFHVFMCPRLMTPYWAKHLNRSADLITLVPLN